MKWIIKMIFVSIMFLTIVLSGCIIRSYETIDDIEMNDVVEHDSLFHTPFPQISKKDDDRMSDTNSAILKKLLRSCSTIMYLPPKHDRHKIYGTDLSDWKKICIEASKIRGERDARKFLKMFFSHIR